MAKSTVTVRPTRSFTYGALKIDRDAGAIEMSNREAEHLASFGYVTILAAECDEAPVIPASIETAAVQPATRTSSSRPIRRLPKKRAKKQADGEK